MRDGHRFSRIRRHLALWYFGLSVGSAQENSVSVTNLESQQRLSRNFISLHKTEYTTAQPYTR